SRGPERGAHDPVALAVVRELPHPVLPVARRDVPVAAMPKTGPDLYRDSCACERDVDLRRAAEPRPPHPEVLPEPEAPPVQRGPQRELRAGVPRGVGAPHAGRGLARRRRPVGLAVHSTSASADRNGVRDIASTNSRTVASSTSNAADASGTPADSSSARTF